MKLTNAKEMMIKAMMVGLAAGTLALAVPQKAQAQVSFGIQVGRPAPMAAYAPGYVAYPRDYWARREYYERLRREEERRRAEIARREWERRESERHHGYGWR